VANSCKEGKVLDFARERSEVWRAAVEKMRAGFTEATQKREEGRLAAQNELALRRARLARYTADTSGPLPCQI
jgi:hypothetical protein